MYAQTTQIDKGVEYYNKKYVIHEILKECKNRDFSFLGKNNVNVRALNIKCVFDFQRALKLVNWNKNKPNIYRGVATLNNIPKFTFNPKKRSSETNPWYEKEYSKQVYKYDLFFDFDDKHKKWNKLKKEVLILKEYLDEYQVPYSLTFSGSKGFHITIPGDYLDIEKIEEGNVYPHKTVVENIKKMLRLEFLDLSNNGVVSRLAKLPYGVVGDNIALPISDEQFNRFNIENMKIENVLGRVSIIRRGTLERFSNLSNKQKRRNLETFIKVFSFK